MTGLSSSPHSFTPSLHPSSYLLSFPRTPQEQISTPGVSAHSPTPSHDPTSSLSRRHRYAERSRIASPFPIPHSFPFPYHHLTSFPYRTPHPRICNTNIAATG